jgi:hypothetical protein
MSVDELARALSRKQIDAILEKRREADEAN